MGTVDFLQFFAATHKEATPIEAERIFYSHLTSVTNPHFMRSIMEIRECGLLSYLTLNANSVVCDVVVRNNAEDLVLWPYWHIW